MELKDAELVDAGWRVLSGALRVLHTSESLSSLAGHPDKLRDLGLIVGGDAARSAIRGVGGVRVPGGEYRVVFGRQATMEILHYIVLPGLSTGMFYAAGSPFMGQMGQQVASAKLSICDDGAAAGLVGSKGITCEGLPTGRTDLIKDGRLVGLLSNYYQT